MQGFDWMGDCFQWRHHCSTLHPIKSLITAEYLKMNLKATFNKSEARIHPLGIFQGQIFLSQHINQSFLSGNVEFLPCIPSCCSW